jgi:hypothetical protein
LKAKLRKEKNLFEWPGDFAAHQWSDGPLMQQAVYDQDTGVKNSFVLNLARESRRRGCVTREAAKKNSLSVEIPETTRNTAIGRMHDLYFTP